MTDKTPTLAPPVLDLTKISFNDWLFDIEIWRESVKERITEKKVGSFLYQHLRGKAQETVRNEIASKDILSDNGAKLIIECLTKCYKKDESRHQYVTYDTFVKFKRPANMAIKDYLVEFNLLYNKVKSFAGNLPDAVLGYSLLENANLSDEKKEICRATCANLNYKEMKTQISKVCVSLTTESLAPTTEKLPFLYNDEHNKLVNKPSIKTERCDDLIAYSENLNDPNQDVFYSNKNYNNRKPYEPYPQKCYPPSSSTNQKVNYRINPKDKFGHTMECNFCHCLYHLFSTCPYKHSSVNYCDYEDTHDNVQFDQRHPPPHY